VKLKIYIHSVPTPRINGVVPLHPPTRFHGVMLLYNNFSIIVIFVDNFDGKLSIKCFFLFWKFNTLTLIVWSFGL
jgi:hypothetical protein